MIREEDVVQIGQITKAHGLAGEVVFIFTDDVFDRVDCDYLICEIDGILVPFFIEEYRFRSNNSALVKFEDIDSIDDTRQIVGTDVFFPRNMVPADENGEITLNYFIGFHVVDSSQGEIGKVIDYDDQTENWLLKVEDAEGKELLLPFHNEFIVNISHDDRILEMRLPEGLLELYK